LTDLKSYFSQGSSSTSRNPSTHGSGVAAVEEVEDNVVPATVEYVEIEGDAIPASVEEEEVEEGAQVQEGITEFNPDHIISDPGLRIPIDRFASNIRDEVRRAFIAKGPTQPIGHRFPPSKDKRSFKKNGLDNTIGWNIVWRRIRLIASIATFLNMIKWMINLVMMPLQKLGSHNGRMLTWHFQNILVGLVAYIMLQQHHVMILINKGQV